LLVGRKSVTGITPADLGEELRWPLWNQRMSGFAGPLPELSPA